ncbi:MAG: TRAP transporter substrate-binding protein DctP [Gracilibacteraceae bacterium]|jgi:TRAP-type C4-dicarboxylate transport system substrate-binding protein|nr:TRAP transporter substrate-binding protein DctP [Gracilibacteraceae bacterium]
MKKHCLCILIAALLFAAAGCAAAPQPQPPSAPPVVPVEEDLATAVANMAPLELKWSIEVFSTYYLQPAFIHWEERVEELTQGKIQVTRYTDQSLMAQGDTYPAVLDGIVEMGEGDPSYATAYFPMLSGFYLAGFSFDSMKAASNTFNDYLHQDFAELQDVKMLWGFCMPASDLLSNVKVETLADLKGRQVRCTGYSADTIARLGAVPVGLTSAETYDALLKGTVDMTLMNASSLEAPLNLGEVTKYVIRIPGISTLPHFIFIDKESWAAIPPAVQAEIEKINLECLQMVVDLNEEALTLALDNAVQNGTHEIVAVSPQEMQQWFEVLAPQVESWIAQQTGKGLDGAAAVEILKELTAKNNELYGDE